MNKYIFQNIIRQQTKHTNTDPDYSSPSHTHTHTFSTERPAVYQSPSQSKLWHLDNANTYIRVCISYISIRNTSTPFHFFKLFPLPCKSQVSWAITCLTVSFTQRGGDSSVVRVPDLWLKGRGFESLLERRENFLLQGRLSVLTLISVSVPPPCYHSST